MNTPQKRRLGRGLAALIGDFSDDGPPEDGGGLRHIPVELVYPNPNNPRRNFKEDELEELARSVREKGLLQPIVVRPRRDGEGYEIVAGERRWRASQRAQLHEVPALVRELNDGEALELAIMENIQRADLNPLEEANGYQQLIERFGYTQQQLADSIGKSRSHIANTLRLLALPDDVRVHIETGNLTAGHARALIATDAPKALADQVIAKGLSVRETEQLAKQRQSAPPKRRDAEAPEALKAVEKGIAVMALERELHEALGLKVDIADRGDGFGRVTIEYHSLEQLDEISRRLRRRT
ncbi:MAG: ParB/RepB/Spo0J family partition protein [Parvibaculaceae bacterium]